MVLALKKYRSVILKIYSAYLLYFHCTGLEGIWCLKKRQLLEIFLQYVHMQFFLQLALLTLGFLFCDCMSTMCTILPNHT